MNFSLKFLTAALLMVAFLFTACEKDELQPVPTPATTQDQTTEESKVADLTSRTNSSDCYDVVYPISFLREDGTSSTANSEAEAEAIVDDMSNPVVDVIYPVTLVNLSTSTQVQVQTEQELLNLIIACSLANGNGGTMPTGSVDTSALGFGDFGCYSYSYPVSFELEDGTTAVAQDVDDVEAIFTTTSNLPVDFVYPVTLIHSTDNTTHVASDSDELQTLLEACGLPGGPGPFPLMLVFACADQFGAPVCYDFTYPLDVVDQDGNTLSISSDSDWDNFMAGPNAVASDFVYPVTVTNLSDGMVESVDDATEAISLAHACFN